MTDLFNRFRSTAGKAAFEADKLKRINSIQLSLRSLRSDMDKAFNEVGRLTFTIYERGEIDQPELRNVCENLLTIKNEIASKEQEIERIRQETYHEPVPSDVEYGGLICPNGHGALATGTTFCQQCGAPGIKNLSTSTLVCGHCGAVLQANARFCANCGQPVPDVMESDVEYCVTCGAELFEDAMFCAECGSPISDSQVEGDPVSDDTSSSSVSLGLDMDESTLSEKSQSFDEPQDADQTEDPGS